MTLLLERTASPRSYAAAAWAALYGTLALVWTVTGRGYPYGGDDLGLLTTVPADVGAPLFAGALLATAVLALATAGPQAVRLRGAPRTLLLGFGWAVVAALLVVVPDAHLLIIAGYAPMLIAGAPFGWPPVDYAEIFTWSLANKAFSVVGGLLLARALLAWQFRTAGACVSCGRNRAAVAGGWTSAAAAARWGRWAAYLAAAIPVLYAVTRFAWLAGIPLGVSGEFLRDLRDSGAVWAGAGLGAFGTVGAVLTLGLVRRWGEVFPRWMVGLAGRRVPITLAVVPATLVAIFVTSASLGLVVEPEFRDLLGDGHLIILPMALWPLWGVALGAATLAYHLRRRGACRHCGYSVEVYDSQSKRTVPAAAYMPMTRPVKPPATSVDR